jgi:hypothetical protein
MTPLNPPRGPAGDSGTAPDKVTGAQAMRYTAWTLILLVVLPPLAVILWRIATMPWG